MKILVNGALGRMGKEVVRLLNEGFLGCSLFAEVDAFAKEKEAYSDWEKVPKGADLIIDFSNHAATKTVCDYASKNGLPLVIGTTGQTEEELSYVKACSKNIPIFISGNMSVGIALLTELVRRTVEVFPNADVEIIEVHHNKKQDAPSGTALMLANSVKEVQADGKFVFGRSGHQPREKGEIGIHAVRLGSVIGEHEVLISTDTEVIKLKHEAKSRSLFAEGAIKVATELFNKEKGFYTMREIIGGNK